MTIPLWTLFAAAMLPYVWHFVSMPLKAKMLGGLDINEPRARNSELTGPAARAMAAQTNAWEALPVFAAATLAAFMAGLDPAGNWSMACMVWVAARLLHGLFYIIGQGILRFLSFVVSLAMSIWIFIMAIA